MIDSCVIAFRIWLNVSWFLLGFSNFKSPGEFALSVTNVRVTT